jgi:hypothetical protein
MLHAAKRGMIRVLTFFANSRDPLACFLFIRNIGFTKFGLQQLFFVTGNVIVEQENENQQGETK